MLQLPGYAGHARADGGFQTLDCRLELSPQRRLSSQRRTQLAGQPVNLFVQVGRAKLICEQRGQPLQMTPALCRNAEKPLSHDPIQIRSDAEIR